MEQYISKAALVAEIERLMKWQEPIMSDSISFNAGHKAALTKLLVFLDTLEVKEVDLEKEIERFAKECGYKSAATIDFQFGKHFFKLGLLASNPITAEDRGTAEEIIINLKRVENDYRIDLTKEIKWVQNKAQKGEEI